jgi:hypothetical protein
MKLQILSTENKAKQSKAKQYQQGRKKAKQSTLSLLLS